VLSSKVRRRWTRHVPTWLWFVNFLILQWMAIRLCRVGRLDTGARDGWGLLVGIVPLTGWWSRYRGIEPIPVLYWSGAAGLRLRLWGRR